jgi:hypothetical protein
MASAPPSPRPRTAQPWGTLARSLTLTAVLLCNASCALAVLGQPMVVPASSTPSAVQLRSATSSTTSSQYTQSSTQLDTGTTVTEYAAPNGMVFAISWQGPVLPDLGTLLGNYFATFRAEAELSRTQRNVGTPLRIEKSNLVVRSSGRMRNFSGSAYAPALVPAGLVIADVLP